MCLYRLGSNLQKIINLLLTPFINHIPIKQIFSNNKPNYRLYNIIQQLNYSIHFTIHTIVQGECYLKMNNARQVRGISYVLNSPITKQYSSIGMLDNSSVWTWPTCHTWSQLLVGIWNKVAFFPVWSKQDNLWGFSRYTWLQNLNCITPLCF